MGEISYDDVYIEPGGPEAVEYIRENHYSGTCNPISNKWVLRHQGSDEIVGAIVFANPISEQVRRYVAGDGNERQVTELHRLYTDDRCGKNVESWFISRALKLLKEKKPKYRFVVSFADQRQGHVGTVYQATNAIYTGTTTETGGDHKFYKDEEGRLRSKRQAGENITMEDAEERGWEIVERGAKHRYVLLLPDRYESKADVLEDLQCHDRPYPKS